MSYSEKIRKRLKNLKFQHYFGFVGCDQTPDPKMISKFSKLCEVEDREITRNFEVDFAKLVGDGDCVSFASARMGLYELMIARDVKTGDEVILLGFTCAVMVNAILRTGARPVFSDISLDTFGSCSRSIMQVSSSRTRMIIAQHSFGIPCDIAPIKKFAEKNGIFLVEDCALTVGSKINGTLVGGFGDAAIFSTDHTKPINTFVGGLVYTEDEGLLRSLRARQNETPALSVELQRAMFKRYIFEQKLCHPSKFGMIGAHELFHKYAVFKADSVKPFLDEDCDLPGYNSYPYPALIPTFSAAVGSHQIQRWKETRESRQRNLACLKSAFEDAGLSDALPFAYFNVENEIVPLRFIFMSNKSSRAEKILSRLIDTDAIWFKQFLEGASVDFEREFFSDYDCPNARKTFEKIVNLPCNIDQRSIDRLLERLKPVIKVLKTKGTMAEVSQ